ncbi:EscU/YscU/HrcU family type III secretion system export apparatus switch protein [Sphingomonas sp. BT-65]|uniref:EscU/YscU/HrcU family type III secretion system export apparatus switch protein n=1 Tax=Sphingomonas sp. BT-65 TaxID=2989821 RepID=UPI002236BBAF|nr:EscU/YscU/HrcU family type III secretion system export apparatus switch protein [Sphingomonas sp. BT-65]MCW4463811.1 EscU/YscU/HrcU family type III secretion system export apparatus switch protein [Sphingomonas sp. BT-65]
MAGEQQDQDRSEAPTPYKLRRARERGMVARSVELGFLGSLIALAAFIAIAGEGFAARIADISRLTFAAGIDRASDPEQAGELIGMTYWSMLQPLLLLGGTVMAVVLLLELIQLRGFIFSAHSLKPDFTRLNPAQGLKRLFSMRLLKETLKTLLKAAVYGVALWLIIADAIDRFAIASSEGERLAGVLAAAGMRLALVFIVIAVCFAILDQVLVRSEFLKQMRMSHREMTREHKEREGDPRIRQKRKQLHKEYASQSQGTGNLPGSDMLVVNPEHFAVALRYDADAMTAPTVSAKGRNRLALALKVEAARLGIPVLRRPELARELYRRCSSGREIPPVNYEAVAELYIQLRREAAAPPPEGPAD